MEQSLEELVARRDKLLKIKKEKNKMKKIRNLKIFSKEIKRIAPYVISTFLTSSIMYSCGYGRPFLVDELNSYKVYEMEYQTPGEMNIKEEYFAKLAVDYFEKSELILYTPYTLCDDGMYIRSKITYKVRNIDALDLYNSLLNEDYEYIINNTVPISNETEKVNMLSSNFVNDYYVDAKITAIDKNDTTTKKETLKTNLFVTFMDLLTGFWVGLIFNRKKRKSYYEEVTDIYRDYNQELENEYLKNKDEYFFYLVEDDYIKTELESLDYKIASLKGAKKL